MRAKPANLNVQMAADSTAVVEIYDDIGPSWAGMIDTKSVASALKELGDIKQIDLRINSRGGSAFEGIGIHNVLKQHPADVTVRIDGVAASAASLIAMAGDTVQMPSNALMMIHEPWVIALGNQDELRKAIEMLGKVNDSGIATYHAKSGQSRQQIAKWLNEETWFTAEEAVEAKLADEVLEAAPEPKQFVSREPFQFQNPPDQLADILAGQTGAPKMAEPTNIPTNDPNPADLTPAEPANEPQPTEPANTPTPPTEPRSGSDPTVEDRINDALAADRKRQSDIRALCRQSGMPDLADHYAQSAEPVFSVEDVREQLFQRMCKNNASPADSGTEPNEDDPDAKFKAEYRENTAILSCSEEEYVATRRIDEGLEVLEVGSAAA